MPKPYITSAINWTAHEDVNRVIDYLRLGRFIYSAILMRTMLTMSFASSSVKVNPLVLIGSKDSFFICASRVKYPSAEQAMK